VTPRPENFQYVKSKPYQLNRFRFNGYADQQLGASTMLSLSLNYAPQKMVSELELGAGAAGTPGNYEFLLRQKNNVFNGSLGMRSDFGKGWFNHFTAAYSSYHVNTNNNTFSMFSNELFGDERDSAFKAKSWWIRNQAGYTAKTGNWQFEPSINVVYRRIDDRLHAAAIRTINNGVTERAEYNASQKGHLLYAVPSFGIQYRSLLALQTGVLQSLKKQPDNFKKFTPYVTASANIVGLIKPAANWSLHTFASYAVANDFGETYYAPNDLLSYNVYKDVGPRTVSGNFDGIKQLQLGATAALFHDRLQFSYNRYQSEFQQLLYVALPGGNPSNFIVVPAEARTVLDRAGISVQVQNTDFKWTTGINASNRRLTLESSQALPGNKKPKEWTGGWVNRIQYGSFNFQLDLAYWTNRQWFNPFVTPQRVEKINSFSLQYIQLGYRFKQLEVYAGARNLFENKKMPFSDGRRYYGGGISASL
ncbi:MAG TPA: hypothetical protein VER36_12295, partial [Flavisolibacter sp.]|nr:hypothetical protein [Flavisolibacter sp.]